MGAPSLAPEALSGEGVAAIGREVSAAVVTRAV